MPRRPRREAARSFSGLSIVVALVLAVVIVAAFIISKALVLHKAGLAATSQPTSQLGTQTSPEPSGTSPVSSPARSGIRHRSKASAAARRARSSASRARPSTSVPSAPAPSSPSPSSPVTQGSYPAADWLMTNNLLNKISKSDDASAKWFFNSRYAFVKGSSLPGMAATPMAGYTSYAQFAEDLADGSFPSGVKWVMFGLESTTNSPEIEKQNPAVYLKDFALLAHQHNLKVIEVPGRDLVGVPGAACHAGIGEKFDHAFLRCQIAADARYADAFLIEAQGDQSDPSAYTALVTGAVNQVRAVAPNIRVMAGLTSDRGDSAAQIFDCWQATHSAVSGYWMNSTTSTLPVAAEALDLIRAAAA